MFKTSLHANYAKNKKCTMNEIIFHMIIIKGGLINDPS